jgi:hypothetical protein
MTRPGYNLHDEPDPREVDQGLLPDVSNTDLSEMALQTLSKARDFPSSFSVDATGANIEELLYELYVENYLNLIEPNDGPLSNVHVLRRAYVWKWRTEFLQRPLHMIKQAPHARDVLIELVRQVWSDVLIIEMASP